MIDNRTALGWPLPHPENDPFSTDVPRLRESLTLIDAAVSAARVDLGERPTTTVVDTKIKAAIDALKGAAPEALDTLVEIAGKLANNDDAVAALVSQIAAKAPIASPNFTGAPSVPTLPANSNTGGIASTQFVRSLMAGADDVPDLVLRAPTRPVGTNTNDVATTGFVQTAVTRAIDEIRPRVGDMLLTRRVLNPLKWKLANGAAYLRATYPDLFALLRTGVFPGFDSVTRTNFGASGTNVQKLVRGNGVYVGVHATNQREVVVRSTDLLNWTRPVVRATTGFSGPCDLAFGNGVFLACVGAGQDNNDKTLVFSSADAHTWTPRLSFNAFVSASYVRGGRGIVFHAGRFVLAMQVRNGQAASGEISHTVNGSAWTDMPTGATGSNRGIYKAGDYVVLVTADGVAYSKDGLSWAFKTNAQLGFSASGVDMVCFARGKIHLFPADTAGGPAVYSARSTTDFQTTEPSFVVSGGAGAVHEVGDVVYVWTSWSGNNRVHIYEADAITTPTAAGTVATTSGAMQPTASVLSDEMNAFLYTNNSFVELRAYTYRPVTEFTLPNINVANLDAYMRVLD